MPGLFILLFLGFFGVILLASGVGFKLMETRQRLRVQQVLKTVTSAATMAELSTLPSQSLELAPAPSAMSPLVEKIAFFSDLDLAIRGATLGWRVESVLFAMAILAGVGYFVGNRAGVLMYPWLTGIAGALAFGWSPVWYIRRTRAKRMAEFERQ